MSENPEAALEKWLLDHKATLIDEAAIGGRKLSLYRIHGTNVYIEHLPPKDAARCSCSFNIFTDHLGYTESGIESTLAKISEHVYSVNVNY